jgi:electron transport complex protein RnfG
MENRKIHPTLQFFVVGLKLLLICVVVAGVISLLYSVTAEQYENNLLQTKRQTMEEIFGREGLDAKVIYTAEDGTVLYRVEADGSAVGFCAEVKSGGFGGDMAITVGYQNDHTVCGVGIVSHSETPGLGAKVNEDEFLSQYVGLFGNVNLGSDVDAISGATISSRAVTQGVNRATEVLNEYLDEQKGGEGA